MATVAAGCGVPLQGQGGEYATANAGWACVPYQALRWCRVLHLAPGPSPGLPAHTLHVSQAFLWRREYVLAQRSRVVREAFFTAPKCTLERCMYRHRMWLGAAC
jgi:hypothetical protein